MKRNRLRLVDLHWGLVLAACSIAALGCYNLHSAAAHHNSRLFAMQGTWVLLGLVAAAALLAVDYRISEGLAYGAYMGVCAMLLAVLLTGKAAMGARRWLVLGPLTFQPSEMAKIVTIFCLARYFSHRVPVGGYSIKGLMRPLNPTRPLACLLVLMLAWQRPWLADPVGELARGIHHKLTDGAPALENLLAFRLALAGIIAVGWVAAMVAINRVERTQALLHPWAAGRKRRLMSLVSLLFVSLGLGLASAWHQDVLIDPFGVAIRALDLSAAPGGTHTALRPSLLLRTILLLGCVFYLFASVVHSRHSRRATVDLCVAPADLLAVPALLVLVEPDLGTAGIIIFIGMTMMLVVGVRVRSLMILGALSTVVAGVAWFGVLKDYQKRRILTFIDPEQDIKGAGWNAVQSLIAVGSGRWMGKGHMGGTQTQLSFLPEQHTDFAFSVWAEEQGFVGCAVLLLLYFVLLSLAFAIASEARDTYGVLLATGVAALILWQAVINIGMVIGLLPVVGITLPLFSYGGSSVMTVMLCIGLLANIHWRRRAS